MVKKISAVIEREIEVYKAGHRVCDNLDYNFHDIVTRIRHYKVDKFLERNGNAIFWNIASPLSPHFQKNIDIDTKDLQPVGQGETNFYQAWVLKMKFSHWIQETQLATTLNELTQGLTDYGVHIFKMVPDEDYGYKLDSVDLSKIFFDTSVKNFEDSSIIEIHEMTENQIMNMEWDNLDKVLTNAEKVEDGNDGYDTLRKYRIYERVGYYREAQDGKFVYMHHIVCGKGDNEVILFEEELEKDDCIYYMFSLKNADNRNTGIGVYERLFKLQERINTLVNENAQTTAIASLLLLRTTDPNTTGNVLDGAVTGQIINSADLQQIGIDNRFLNGFINEINIIKTQARELCMTPEVIVGESMPSGVTFRGQAATTNAARSAFKNTRDNIGSILSYILLERILPEIVKDWNKGEMMEISEDAGDIKLYDDAIKLNAKIKLYDNANKAGIPITPELEAQMNEKVDRTLEISGRKIEIEKGFFNFNYGIKINVTGEAVDKAQRNDAYSNILQWIQTNPAIQENPYFRQYCEDNGITPIRMKVQAPLVSGQMAMQQGGGQVPQEAISPVGQASESDKLSKMIDITV